MTPLGRIIADRIRATGPITLADYMADCLMHPTHGYYATRDPFGAAGDFTTAPEISQMFGELLGLCLAQAWLDQGSPEPPVMAELGPGRGTLMKDMLRSTARVPGFHAALSVHLVEASPHLRQVQAATLAGIAPVWHDSAATLPDAPLFLIANEFFDALPIRQFRRTRKGWCEYLVGLTGETLLPGLSPPLPEATLGHRLKDAAPGEVVEICPALPAIITELAERIARHGGAAVMVDYGGWQSRGDTFQALRHHVPTDPLAEPGLADLTAHVDFAAIAAAAPPISCSAMMTQGALLARLGIDLRAERLALALHGPALTSHLAAFHRLTDPLEMGHLFKAIALYPKGALIPPGFDA